MQASTYTPQRYRWSVAEYHQLGDTGVLSADERIELIDGELIEMAPIGSDHGGNVNRLNHRLSTQLGAKALVSVQNPVVLGQNSEPQPDLMLLRWRDDFYTSANPKADDVLLIIEVSDTTAQYDREVKVPLYAQHDIPEVWLIDLPKQRLETYRKPADGDYSEIIHHRQGRLSALLLSEAVIDLAELFPKRHSS